MMIKKLLMILIFLSGQILYSKEVAKQKEVKRNGVVFQVMGGDKTILYYRGDKKKIQSKLIALEDFTKTQYSRFFDSPLNEKVSIFLYKNKNEYLGKNKVPKDYFAHYESSSKEILTFFEAPIGTLFHEVVHAWDAKNIQSTAKSLWFEEGFASYFESAEKKEDGSWEFNKPNWRMKSIQGKWTHLSVFMKSVELRETHSKAQARVFFLWLAKLNLLETFVKKYKENVDFDPSGIDALNEVTGKDINETDKEMHDFSDSLSEK